MCKPVPCYLADAYTRMDDSTALASWSVEEALGTRTNILLHLKQMANDGLVREREKSTRILHASKLIFKSSYNSKLIIILTILPEADGPQMGC